MRTANSDMTMRALCVFGGIVAAATTASAAPPVVSAGADQNIEAPSVVLLTGSATDDGPSNSLTYSWSAEPAGVTFTAPNAASSEARIPAAGTYTLTLTVTDGAESGSDALVVTANPAVYPVADDDTQVDNGWLRVAAADVGMNQALLDQAAAYAASAPSGPGAGMIVRHGRLVHAWGDIDLRYDVKSTT
jgi:hypothetical protein